MIHISDLNYKFLAIYAVIMFSIFVTYFILGNGISEFGTKIRMLVVLLSLPLIMVLWCEFFNMHCFYCTLYSVLQENNLTFEEFVEALTRHEQ